MPALNATDHETTERLRQTVEDQLRCIQSNSLEIENLRQQLRTARRAVMITFDSIEGSFVVRLRSGQVLKFDKPKQVAGNIEGWLASLRHSA